MYPDLSYILHDLFGTEPDNAFSLVKTFGLLLFAAIAASGWVLSSELRRKEKKGQLRSQLEKNKLIYKPIDWKEIGIQTLVNFLFGYKIVFLFTNYKSFQRDPSEAIFSVQGNWFWGFLIGGVTAIYWIYQMNHQEQKEAKYGDIIIKPVDRVVNLTILAGLYGILGSKLFSVFENFGDFVRDPVGSLFSGAGLTVYGGLILAFIMLSRYMKAKGLPLLHMYDAIAPTLMVGYGIGRLGCHFSGDGDWGIVNEIPKPNWFIFPDSWWSYSYPHNVAEEGIKIAGCNWNYCQQLVPSVFPTPLYEFILAFIIFGILWILRTRIQYAGVLFFIYVTLNGVERFFIETIRVNPRYDILGFHPSLSQGIALLLIITGIIGSIYFYRKKITS
ncbi:MAG: prolipoprotein diacylglyceryl transferase [Saprospiraceae bacterium]|nr:prolipoprotein diacylglyceryl transferase [Saprospiraceae bacterium]